MTSIKNFVTGGPHGSFSGMPPRTGAGWTYTTMIKADFRCAENGRKQQWEP
jgi:hypothetical protein